MPAISKSFFLLWTLLSITAVQAHIELMFPPPINSKYDPQTREGDKDYSMTTPLASDGSNYPCKGYVTASKVASLNSVATLNAGSPFSLNLTGSATHGGGSCQFGLSYDGGATFAVITSIIGGCPLSQAYTIDIPAEVPAGKKVIFFWNWFNEVGNRESYQNCAVVDVVGTSKSWTAPAVYRANTLSDGSCQTIPNKDFVYPNPGPNVQYGGSMSKSSPASQLSPCSFDQNKMITFTSSGGSSTSATPREPAGSVAPPAPVVPRPTPVVADTPSSTAVVLSTATTRVNPTRKIKSPKTAPRKKLAASPVVDAPSATPTVSATSADVAATPSSDTVPSEDSTSSSSVDAPASTPTTSSTSSPTSNSNEAGSAHLKCTSLTTFSLCDSNLKCTPMGNVAAGTKCTNDTISFAKRSRSRRSHSSLKKKRNSKVH